MKDISEERKADTKDSDPDKDLPPFLRLPRELRDVIWHHCLDDYMSPARLSLDDNRPLVWDPCCNPGRCVQPFWINITKQIRQECLPILYSSRPVEIHISKSSELWPTKKSPVWIKRMKWMGLLNMLHVKTFRIDVIGRFHGYRMTIEQAKQGTELKLVKLSLPFAWNNPNHHHIEEKVAEQVQAALDYFASPGEHPFKPGKAKHPGLMSSPLLMRNLLVYLVRVGLRIRENMDKPETEKVAVMDDDGIAFLFDPSRVTRQEEHEARVYNMLT